LPNPCEYHEDLLLALQKLSTNVAWLANIGKWFLSFITALVVLLTPLIIALLVYIAEMDKKIAVTTQATTTNAQKLEEHCRRSQDGH